MMGHQANSFVKQIFLIANAHGKKLGSYESIAKKMCKEMPHETMLYKRVTQPEIRKRINVGAQEENENLVFTLLRF